MDNKQLNEEIQKQEKENQEYLNKILLDVQKEIDEVCKKYNVILGANIVVTPDGIRPIPAIKKANSVNPYKQS